MLYSPMMMDGINKIHDIFTIFLEICHIKIPLLKFLPHQNNWQASKLTAILNSLNSPDVSIRYLYDLILFKGYRKVFEQYAAILEQKYPSLAIEGENHPPPFLNQKIAQFLGIVKILLILLVVSGTNIFQHLGVQTPSVWEWTQQNKFYACLMTFFLCNAVEGQLISTGAFEITLNDVPLWSKLETGRIPQPPELFQMIDNHLSMATPKLSLDS
uniref:EOG090X0DP2 n=1 Tax=Daphnia similis TaxID=35528 RepID=A0A4Y7N060_9CRUS|nr:EOG090X0DP2 [Daphnia similis]SVE87018.1 EOG090X0DP2 [Daphnia similis]SVE87641.1 EOG090X0DP2 [Daphnia similis]SVE88272.1 EOG090X0DP2 [Daphnia similis]